MVKFYSLQHLYPKSQVDVFITILEDDGSSLAAAITCAGLAVAEPRSAPRAKFVFP